MNLTRLKAKVKHSLPGASRFGYHHSLALLLVLSIVFHCMLLLGSNPSSSPLRSLHTLSLQYINGTAQLEVRAGYFGVCARTTEHTWKCASTSDTLPLSFQSFPDPFNTIAIASKFKSDVLFPALIILADILSLLSIIGFLVFPNWREEVDEQTGSVVDVKPFPSHAIMRILLVAIAFATTLAFAAALWQHTSASSIVCLAETASRGSVHASVGIGAVVLVWITVLLLALVFLAMLPAVLAVTVLDRLTDED